MFAFEHHHNNNTQSQHQRTCSHNPFVWLNSIKRIALWAFIIEYYCQDSLTLSHSLSISKYIKWNIKNVWDNRKGDIIEIESIAKKKICFFHLERIHPPPTITMLLEHHKCLMSCLFPPKKSRSLSLSMDMFFRFLLGFMVV